MELIEVKADELTGSALDWATAKAQGLDPWITPFGGVGSDSACWACSPYKPSTRWDHGGPLMDSYADMIERHDGCVVGDAIGQVKVMHHGGWRVSALGASGLGATKLMALCRAIVIAKLGDLVQVPALLFEVTE